MTTVFTKDPEAVLDYSFDWEDWLGSDTIDSVTWTLQSGITLDDDTNTTTMATATISGGTAGSTYKVECKIETTAGLIDERSFYIKVVER